MVTVNEAPTTNTELRIPLDAMHNGIRMAVIGTFVGSGVTSFFIASALLPNIIGLAIVVGGVVAAGSSMGVERTLKDRWPSGREFIANSERITVTKDDKMEFVIDAQQQVNVLTWRFEVKKDSPRAKKGWQLLGLALQQDDTYVIVYTAMTPDDFDEMPLASAFTKLEKKKEGKKDALGSTNGLRRAGEQKRLHDAEIARQLIGGDMMKDDFIRTLEYLQATYPRWMVSE